MDEILKANHNCIIEDRKKFTLTGIRNVITFDDETIMLDTNLGKLAVKGTGLHILNFNTEIGDLSGEGRVHALIYTHDSTGGGFFNRIFR